MTGVMTDTTNLQPGARNAIRVCLNVQPHERVTLITDEACRDIARGAGARDRGRRRAVPRSSCSRTRRRGRSRRCRRRSRPTWSRATVSIFAARAQANELGSRMQMTDIVNRRRMRHAHMVNITRQIMLEGMRADYRRGRSHQPRVLDIVRPARTIRATTPAGTRLHARRSIPRYRWIKTSGLITPEKWGNLPGGEVFTTPGEVNGTFVIDGVVGDWLCDRYGDARTHAAHAADREEPARRRDARRTQALATTSGRTRTPTRTATASASSRSARTSSCGTSSATSCRTRSFRASTSRSAIPYGAHTGADWYSSTHIDVVGTDFDIWVDERADHAARAVPHRPGRGVAAARHIRDDSGAGASASIAEFSAPSATAASRARARTAHAASTIEFRLSETPCFFPAEPARPADRRVSHELIGQLLDNPAYLRAADAIVPPAFRVAARRDAADVSAGSTSASSRRTPVSRAGSSSCRRSRRSTDFSWRWPRRRSTRTALKGLGAVLRRSHARAVRRGRAAARSSTATIPPRSC